MNIRNIKFLIILLISLLTILSGIPNISNSASTYYQYVKTGINNFPDSYKTRLQELIRKYPNWKFQAYYTGIPWEELVENERDESIYRNRVTVNAPRSWKHCDFVDNGWACASDEIVKYYLDPRNFLNETQIFQFVESSYNEKVQTLSTIKNSVNGTFLDNTITCEDSNGKIITMSYSEIILQAAKESNISAFYIKSKIIQEVGINGSGSITGKYSGYEGYYNFYNFGAYDEGDPIANGLKYAKEKGWNSQYKAIVDGAKLIGKNYIEQGQNTAYFNKWDVVGTKILKEGESQTVKKSDMFWHQYMTNIQDPTSQSYSNYKLYSNSLQSEITFIIPIYDNMPPSNPMPQDISVQSITMNKDKFIVNINEKDIAKVSFNPINSTNKNIIWTSSNLDTVRVWNGEFRGLKEGTSILTATTEDGGKKASCTVYVRDPNKQYIETIKIEKEQYLANINEALDISFSYFPNNSINADLEWLSSDPEILRVWGNKFRALKAGTADIIARTKDGTVETRCKVIVKDPNKSYVQNIKIEKQQYVSNIDEAIDIQFSYTPQNSVNAEFEWTSSNPEILRVWGNRFRGLKEGTAEVIARAKDGTVETRCKVIIRDSNKSYVQNIDVEKTQYAIGIDEAIDIPFSYTPKNSINAEFEWISSNPEILRVWGNRFRGLKEGTAQVIVKTKDGTVAKKIQVIVKDYSKIKVENINVSQKHYIVGINEAIDIPFNYTPEDSINAEFEWISSNPEILRVWGNRFRALKEGTAQVIVRTVDKTVETKIQVEVKDYSKVKVDNIKLEQSQYIINLNDAIDIEFSYTPKEASNAEFEWTSSNPQILRVWGNRFRGLKEGTAEVIIRTKDGTVETRCKVIIKDPNKPYVQNINIQKTQYTVGIDEVVDIPFSYTPKNSINAEFEWTSSNPQILRVWGNRFRALKKGEAQLIVRTKDKTVEKILKVTVK